MPAMNDHSSSPSYNFSNKASSCLRSIRNISSKPEKKPPLPRKLPPEMRFYSVESSSFRELVQELTGAPKFQPYNRLRHLAPPPINIIKPTPQQHIQMQQQLPQSQLQQQQQQQLPQSQQQIQMQHQLPQSQLQQQQQQLPQSQQQQQQQQLEPRYEHHEIPSTVAYDIDLSSPQPLVEVSNGNLFDSNNSPSVAAAMTSIGLMSPTTWNTWCSASPPLCSPGTTFELYGV